MISDEFKHEVGSYMQRQADRLLAHQAGIARASYNTRTGSLARALASKATVQDATGRPAPARRSATTRRYTTDMYTAT